MTAVLDVPGADRVAARARDPLQTVWEDDDRSPETRGSGMPIDLERRYGGPLTIPLRSDRPTVMANFVSTIDGIVALGTGQLSGGGPISGFHEPDRFVMGLLRALADVVVVGAGTLRGSDAHRWTPGHVHPASAASFGAWREAMGLSPVPRTVIVTAGGDIPTGHPGLADPGIPVVVATTPAGASRLASTDLGEHVAVRTVETRDALAAHDVLRLATEDGARVVLTEGGPHLLGSFVDADLLDELFLTVSPQLVGRAGQERLGLVEGVSLAPEDGRWQHLVSVRRSTDHLFLRYRRTRDAADGEA
ncbi:MAG TPA: dihydrofolate reductase family protein [Candidatus Limnocylindrales bacterium]